MSGTELHASERIFRFEVPVNDQWHGYALQGDPLFVAARSHDLVEFWARHVPKVPGIFREFRVVGTGHLVPTDARHWGSAVIGPFVWHLIERRS